METAHIYALYAAALREPCPAPDVPAVAEAYAFMGELRANPSARLNWPTKPGRTHADWTAEPDRDFDL